MLIETCEKVLVNGKCNFIRFIAALFDKYVWNIRENKWIFNTIIRKIHWFSCGLGCWDTKYTFPGVDFTQVMYINTCLCSKTILLWKKHSWISSWHRYLRFSGIFIFLIIYLKKTNVQWNRLLDTIHSIDHNESFMSKKSYYECNLITL